MIENNGMQINNNQNKFNEDIDESTFILWKSELQKELSSFWETLNRF